MSKKNFKPQLVELNNPAMQFISQENTQDPTLNKATANINKTETRNKRLQVLLQPSLHQAIKNKANSQQRSVNDLIHEALRNLFNQ
jgi:predicted HicB family RNase H-like nuclease